MEMMANEADSNIELYSGNFLMKRKSLFGVAHYQHDGKSYERLFIN